MLLKLKEVTISSKFLTIIILFWEKWALGASLNRENRNGTKRKSDIQLCEVELCVGLHHPGKVPWSEPKAHQKQPD